MKGSISRVTFNRAVGTGLESGVLSEVEPENRYRLLVNYLDAFEAELHDKRLLVRSAYFEAICEILDEVVRNSLQMHRNAKQESLLSIIRPLAQLNFSGPGGLPTKKFIVRLMQVALRQNVALSDHVL